MTLDIDLWLWSLDGPDPVPALSRLLSADEQDRAARFVRARDRRRYVAGRGRVREILATYTGQQAAALTFSYGAQKKPCLSDGPAFNLSHADGWAALVVAPGHSAAELALGVDIEAERRIGDGVAARFFSRREHAALAALPQGAWMDGFLRCWTRKEAVIKAAGSGLSTPLDSFDVSLVPGDPARVERTSGDLAPAAAWSLIHLDLAPRFVGAVAVAGRGQAPRLCLKQGRLPLR